MTASLLPAADAVLTQRLQAPCVQLQSPVPYPDVIVPSQHALFEFLHEPVLIHLRILYGQLLQPEHVHWHCQFAVVLQQVQQNAVSPVLRVRVSRFSSEQPGAASHFEHPDEPVLPPDAGLHVDRRRSEPDLFFPAVPFPVPYLNGRILPKEPPVRHPFRLLYAEFHLQLKISNVLIAVPAA